MTLLLYTLLLYPNLWLCQVVFDRKLQEVLYVGWCRKNSAFP